MRGNGVRGNGVRGNGVRGNSVRGNSVRGNSVRGNGVQGNVVRGWVSWLCYCYWKSPRIALSRHSSNLFSYIPVSLIASQRASGMECIYFIESIPSAKTMFGIGVTEKGVIQ